MSETLITEGQNTQAADPQQAAGTQTEGQQAQGGEQTATQQQAVEGQQAQGQTTEGQQAQGEQGKKPEGAPKSYEFKAAEGTTFDDAVIGAFSEVAKDLNLSQEDAQKVLDKVAPVIQARQAEQITAAQTAWAEQSKADKEFGGDKLQENLAVAKQALDTFGTPELRTLLNESGMGNHPEVIRFMVRAGKAISEDRFVSGGGGVATKSDARRLYAASNMNP